MDAALLVARWLRDAEKNAPSAEEVSKFLRDQAASVDTSDGTLGCECEVQ